MADQHFLKRNWKFLLNVVTIAALLGLTVLIWDQIVDTFRNLQNVNLWIISLMIPLLMVNYFGQAYIYQSLFKMLGHKLSFKFLFRTALEINFINKVFPSGGVTGISYFGVRLRAADISGGRATIVQIMRLLLQFASFVVLLIIGLLVLAVGGQANNMVILVGSSISTLLVIATLAFGYVVGSERRIHSTFKALAKAVNKAVHFFKRGNPEIINIASFEAVVQDIHLSYKMMFKDIRKMRGPFLWGVTINAAEVLSVYAVFAAFGEWVNIGAIILAYAVANFAGLIAVLPGGVGVYEVLMTGVLTAAGVPLALSLPATVMFRVISTVLQVIPGYYFYHKTVGNAGRPPTTASVP